MLLPDVNILVYAYHEDASPRHEDFKRWLQGLVDGAEAFGMSEFVLSGFLRVVTNRAVFEVPAPLEGALKFAKGIQSLSHCVRVTPGPRHWGIFVDLCKATGARANLIPDAYFAALAIESGSEWVTMDGGFARFPRLRWRRPF